MIVKTAFTAKIALTEWRSGGQSYSDGKGSRVINETVLEQPLHNIGPVAAIAVGYASALHRCRYSFYEGQDQNTRVVEQGKPS
jgi:hypothetical protein